MEQFAHAMADFVREHQAWAAPVVFVLAFGESLAFISLLIPAWGALVAIGALIGASGLSFYPVWIAGGFGAANRSSGLVLAADFNDLDISHHIFRAKLRRESTALTMPWIGFKSDARAGKPQRHDAGRPE